MFVDAVETLLRKEDRLVIPLAERLTGRKSTRLPRSPRQSGAGPAVAVAAVTDDDVIDDAEVVEGDGIDDEDADETAIAESDGVEPGRVPATPAAAAASPVAAASFNPDDSAPELVPEPDDDDDPDATMDAAAGSASGSGDEDEFDDDEFDDDDDALEDYEEDPNETLAADDVGVPDAPRAADRFPGLTPGSPVPGRIPTRRPQPGDPPRPRRRRRRRHVRR